jgi:hypothetical protein
MSSDRAQGDRPPGQAPPCPLRKEWAHKRDFQGFLLCARARARARTTCKNHFFSFFATFLQVISLIYKEKSLSINKKFFFLFI